MPGLINTHTHIGMHSLRGICDDEELPNWLDKVITAETNAKNIILKTNEVNNFDFILL